MANNELQHLLPRHTEIMRRLCLGEKQREIARDLGMSEGRLSIIVNSPLFQLELRRMQRRKEEKIAEIQERIIEGAEKAINLHNQIIDGFVSNKRLIEDECGAVSVEEEIIPIPLAARQQSSTAIANLFLRLTKGGSVNPADTDEEGGYEERLEKEVTFKETTTVRRGGEKKLTREEMDQMLDGTHPTDDAIDEADVEGMDKAVEAAL